MGKAQESPGERLRAMWERLAPMPGGKWLFSKVVGLTAPRGPQLPVYSAQARLIAKFLTAGERSGIVFSATHAKASRPEARIDIPRHEWQRDMDRTHRRIDRILRRTPARAAAPCPSRDYLAIHG